MIKVKNRKVVDRLSNRSLKANQTRNLVAVIAIALTALLFTSLFTMGIGTAENLQRAAMRQAGGDGHALLKYITQAQYDAVKDNPAIEQISFKMPLCDDVENEALLKRRAEFWYYDQTGLALDFVELTAGRMPETDSEIIADTKTLELLGVPLEEGAPVELKLLVHGREITRTLYLSGWWESDPIFNVGRLVASRAYVGTHADELTYTYYDDYSMAGVINASIMFKNSMNLEEKLNTLLVESGFSSVEGDPNYVASNVNWSYLSTNMELDPTAVIVLASALLLIILTGYLIIYNIFQISVVKDIRFYGLLKTIGTTSRQIRRLIHRQALILSAIGIPFGLVLGFFCGTALVPLLMQNSSYAGTQISVAPNPYIFIGAAVFALLTVLISTSRPARMAGRVSPIEAVHYSDAGSATKRGIKNTVSGTKMHRMALSNLGRNKKRTGLVVTSFSLCLILLCAVVTVSDSIDMNAYISKFNDSDFQIAHADYFNNDFCGTENQLSQTMIDAVQEMDGFESGGYIYGGRLTGFFTTDPNYTEEHNKNEYGDVISAVYGIDGLPFESLELLDGEIDLEKLLTGDYILEGVQLDDNGKPHMDRIHFNVGDKVTLHTYGGEDTDDFENREYIARKYTVLGHVAIHYTSNSDRIGWSHVFYMPSEVYKQIVDDPAIMCYNFNVAEDKEAAAEAFIKDYCDHMEPMMNYSSKTATKESFAGMQNTVSMVGGALGGVVGLIGILNFINAMLTGIISRRREFAMLQSIGMTRGQLKTMLCFEGLYYAGLSGAASLVLGILFSVTILRAICTSFWFMRYQPVFWPLLTALPVLLLLGVIIPLVIYGVSDRETIVERLRESE